MTLTAILSAVIAILMVGAIVVASKDAPIALIMSGINSIVAVANLGVSANNDLTSGQILLFLAATLAVFVQTGFLVYAAAATLPGKAQPYAQTAGMTRVFTALMPAVGSRAGKHAVR